DVGEQHRGVDVVTLYRLERHLGAELGCPRELEERVPLAERAIFGERAPGLPHEPDRRALDLLAPESAHQKRLGHNQSVGTTSSVLPGKRGRVTVLPRHVELESE